MNLTIKNLECGRFGDKSVSTHKTNAVALCLVFAAWKDLVDDDEYVVPEDLLGGALTFNLSQLLCDYDYKRDAVQKPDNGIRAAKIVEICTALDTKGFFAEMTEEGTFGVCIEGNELALKAEMGRIEISEELGEDW